MTMKKSTPIFVLTILGALAFISGVHGQDDWTCKTAELLEGTEGKIFCLPRRGAPFETHWRRDYKPIDNGTEFRIERDGLVILKVDRTHGGSYRVSWTDADWGTESSKDVTVVVLAPPRFADPTSLIVDTREGENATLELKIDGLPKPECRWYDKTAKPVFTSDRMKVGNCTLFLYDVEASDAGTYTCIATNKVSVATASATLTLDGKSSTDQIPHPLAKLEVRSVTSTSLTIHAETDGTGEPVTSVHCIYRVLHSRMSPQEKSASWLVGPGVEGQTLNGLKPGFLYRLHCASMGVNGLSSRWTAAVDVKLLPPGPEIWLQMLSQEVLRFQWDIPSNNVLLEGNAVQEYQLSYKTVNRIDAQWEESSSCPVLVTTCGRNWDIHRPGNRYYSAKVRARNDGGWSEWSQEVKVGGATF